MKEQHEDPRDRRTLPLPELYDSGPGASPEDDEEPITENQPALPPPRSVSGKERFTLVVLEGHDAGAVFDVDRPNLKVGRGRDADLRLDDPGVSRTHAVVSRIGSAVYLEDLGSMNGTLVDGVRICGARRLGDRQRVGLGTTTLRFSVQDSLEADLAVRLYESSVRDPLTRLYNRRHFPPPSRAVPASSLSASPAVLAPCRVRLSCRCSPQRRPQEKTLDGEHGISLLDARASRRP